MEQAQRWPRTDSILPISGPIPQLDHELGSCLASTSYAVKHYRVKSLVHHNLNHISGVQNLSMASRRRIKVQLSTNDASYYAEQAW